MYFSVAKQFSIFPGARYRKTSNWSAQELYEDHLEVMLKQSVKYSIKLHFDLDGTCGYGVSFLHQLAFLIKTNIPESIPFIRFISKEEPYLVEEFMGYIDSIY